jgi:hypothetical protein
VSILRRFWPYVNRRTATAPVPAPLALPGRVVRGDSGSGDINSRTDSQGRSGDNNSRINNRASKINCPISVHRRCAVCGDSGSGETKSRINSFVSIRIGDSRAVSGDTSSHADRHIGIGNRSAGGMRIVSIGGGPSTRVNGHASVGGGSGSRCGAVGSTNIRIRGKGPVSWRQEQKLYRPQQR